MKYYSILILCIVCFGQSLAAQDNALLKKISFRISVTNFDSTQARGWLATIGDSSIQVSNHPVHFGSASLADASIKNVDFNQVSLIKLKRNNGAGRGAIIGAVCGFIVGAVAGFIQGDDPHVPASQDFFGFGEAFRMTAAEKAGILGISGAAVMGGAGAIIGAFAKKTFIIGGKKEKFDQLRINVLDKAYRNNQ